METLTEQIERVKRMVGEIPVQLTDARRVAADKRKAVDAAKVALADLEAETLTMVSGETNDAGKAAFTNKEAREAEVRRRLRGDQRYQVLAEQLAKAETDKLNAELHLNQLQDEERALDRTLDAVGHQVRAESIRQLTKSVVELTALEAKRMAGMGA